MNRLDIFGTVYDFGKKIDWHQDPKTNNHWPQNFWADINIRDGFTIGGPKFVWEINRLYCLPVLAMAFQSTQQEKYGDKIFSLIEEWLDANPYPMGVNWTSGIELSTRIANLTWALSFLEGYPLTDDHNKLINQFVWLHGRHLHRYPSKYSSNNNHAIAEAFALFVIGVFFTNFKEAKKWTQFGKEVLERECGRQILSDGGSYECSTTYLSFVFDFFLLYKIVCDSKKISYDPIIDTRLEQSCEFIHALMDENGNMPNIGDQDSAVLVNFGLNNHENFRSILNTGAVLFDRPEWRRPGFPDLKTVVLLGRDKCETGDVRRETGIPPGPPLNNPPQPPFEKGGGEERRNGKGEEKGIKGILLKESGLGVIRGYVQGKKIVFVGNATPLGMPPLYAHGHLDALSLTLSVAGLEFLVDPGTYLYHSGGKWRRYFRSTAAHNTIRINETDLTDMPGDFMFGKPYRITEHSLEEVNDQVIWKAEHDAYQRLPVPVFHNRQVIVDKKAGFIEISDRLDSSGKYLAEQFYHLHPECSVDLEGNKAIVSRAGIVLEMVFDSQMSVEAYRGSENPLLGWFSREFNHLEETTTIVCTGEFAGNVILATDIRIG